MLSQGREGREGKSRWGNVEQPRQGKAKARRAPYEQPRQREHKQGRAGHLVRSQDTDLILAQAGKAHCKQDLILAAGAEGALDVALEAAVQRHFQPEKLLPEGHERGRGHKGVVCSRL